MMNSKENNNDKLKDVKFIKDFNKITLKKVFEEEEADTSNFYKLEISKEKLHNIKLNIDSKIKKLYEDYYNESNTL